MSREAGNGAPHGEAAPSEQQKQQQQEQGRPVGALELAVTGLTSAFHKTTIAPIERVRLLTQAHGELRRHGRDIEVLSPEVLRGGTSVSASLRRLIPSSLDFIFNGTATSYFRHVRQQEGYAGFFRGNGLSAASAMLGAPLSLYVVSPLHRGILRYGFFAPSPELRPNMFVLANAVAAVVSGAVASIFLYPLEVLRVLLTVDVKRAVVGSPQSAAPAFEYASLRSITAAVARGDFSSTSGSKAHEYGLGAFAPYACLYRGLWLGIVGQVLYRTSFAGMYEAIGYMRGTEQFSGTQEFAVGYGMMATCTMGLYPLDTVRRRYMRAGMSRRAVDIEREMASRGMSTAADAAMHTNPDAGAALAYRSVSECAEAILREEGPLGFFRGASMLPVRSLALTATAFVVPRICGSYMMQ